MSADELLRRLPHPLAVVGPCPFCRGGRAELWRDPGETDKPFQVRCDLCEARGPKCDCGWEAAVPAWQSVERRTLSDQQNGGSDG